MCADFVPVNEDSNEWRRFYENMLDGVDHKMSEFFLGASLPQAGSKNLATDKDGVIQAPVSAENVTPPPPTVDGPYTAAEPDALDDPKVMSRKKYSTVAAKRGRKPAAAANKRRKRGAGVAKRTSGGKRKRPSLSRKGGKKRRRH